MSIRDLYRKLVGEIELVFDTLVEFLSAGRAGSARLAKVRVPVIDERAIIVSRLRSGRRY